MDSIQPHENQKNLLFLHQDFCSRPSWSICNVKEGQANDLVLMKFDYFFDTSSILIAIDSPESSA